MNFTPEETLANLQQDIADRIASGAYFADIGVITDRKSDIVTEIQKALSTLTRKGGKMGACVVVMAPVGKLEYPNVPTSPMETLITLLVLESPLFNLNEANGTLKNALSICMALIDQVRLYAPYGLANTLVADTPCIVPVQNTLAPVAYEVRFKTLLTPTNPLQRVEFPTISLSGSSLPTTVTISCSTPDAMIHYTLDGKYPSSVNGSHIYTDPFVVESPSIVRAVAYKAGCIPSSANFTKLS